jgi:hypothetical protein
MFEIQENPPELIKIFGQEFSVTRPKVKQIKELNSARAEMSDEEQFDLLVKFVTDLGVPEDTLQRLEMGQLEGLIKYLSDNKKN